MLEVTWQGHTLFGIPAIHDRMVFAELIQQAFADLSRRAATSPGSLCCAVELPPSAVTATLAFLDSLRGLGIGAGGEPMPPNLGLVCKINRLHPRLKEEALRLQGASGRPLDELPMEQLAKALDFTPYGLVCLNPGDSIIELCRCAQEGGIPLHGIDAVPVAGSRERTPFEHRDPLAARQNYPGYVRQLGQASLPARDDYTDGRRETIMAARLKTLLQRYDRVLWTGGIAHWAPLCALLADDRVQPATNLGEDDQVQYQRVLLHPVLAAPHLDVFPRLTAAYEAARRPVTEDSSGWQALNFQAELHRCLNQACAPAAMENPVDDDTTAGDEGWHRVTDFTGYMLRLAALRQCLVPDMGTILTAARSMMMPAAFIQRLRDSLMEGHWASPRRFPDLPIIEPNFQSVTGAGDRQPLVSRLPVASGEEGEPGYVDSAPFYLSSFPGTPAVDLRDYGWKWQDAPKKKSAQGTYYGNNFIWPPCEDLFYATIYEAIHIVDAQAVEQRTEAFRGSLHEGIDLKATLRSALKDKPQIMVKRAVKRPLRRVSQGEPVSYSYSHHLEVQPTVFIFALPSAADFRHWSCLNAGTDDIYQDLSARAKRLYDRLLVRGGDYVFIESVSCSEILTVPEAMQPWVSGLNHLHGIVRFGNPCVNFYQGAAWLEKGGFKAAPILPGSFAMDHLTDFYQKRHALTIDRDDWANALILMALPYAHFTHRVLVVCPTAFALGEPLRREAQRRGVDLVKVPLSLFPARRITQIRHQYSVKTSQGGKVYPPELTDIFGQTATANRHLLPLEIRRQALPPSRSPARGARQGAGPRST